MTHRAYADERSNKAELRPDDALFSLLLAAANGCNASFARLYERTHRRMFGIVLRIVRHRGEAEEVLQEVYVRAWARSDQFDPQRGLVIHWLASIALRAAIDCRRRASSRPSEAIAGAEGQDPYEHLTSPYASPPDVFELEQRHRLVREQLNALPDDQKESLVMAFLDGITHPEIAARLSCPLGTIKGRVRRALLSMRPPLLALSQ